MRKILSLSITQSRGPWSNKLVEMVSNGIRTIPVSTHLKFNLKLHY